MTLPARLLVDRELPDEDTARQAMRADEPIDDDHLEQAVVQTESSIDAWTDRDRYADSDEGSALPYFS